MADGDSAAIDLVAGREKRRARLFARYSDGARLTREEKAEIADLVSEAEAKAKENDLRLEAGEVHQVNRRTGLRHPILHYAELLEVGPRTVKRWLATGIKAQRACPLDDLTKFRAWWAAVHPQRALETKLAVTLDRLLTSAAPVAAGEGVKVENTDPTSTEKNEVPATGGAAPRPALALSDVAAMTLEENLEKLKLIHAANVQLLERAFQQGSQSEVDARQRNVERSARMLIEAQTSLNDHLKQLGELVSREEIKRELLRIHTAMAQSLVGLFVQCGVHRERALMHVSSWYSHLRGSKFATATQPELRGPVESAA